MLLSNNVPMMSHSKRIAVIVGIALVYLVTARLGLLLAMENGVVTAVWPPSGVALAGLLIFGRGVWPGIWIGSFAANLWPLLERSPAPNFTTAVLASVILAAGSTGAAWFSAWALTQMSGAKKIASVREVGMFLLYGVLLGCLISSINGASLLCLSGLSPVSAWLGIWLTWWMGDAFGVLLFTPFLMAWVHSGEKFKRERPIEAIACITLLIATAWYVYTSQTSLLFGGSPNDIILLPALAWVGLRLGYRGITLALVLTCLIAIWGTTNGHGPYVRPTLNQSLISLDLALLCLIATGLSIAAVLQQWKNTKAELAAANLHLEERVVQRTRELLITTAELRATADEQARASEALRIYTQLSQDLNRAMTVSEAGRLITNTAEELIGWDATLLILLDNTTGLCRSVLAIDLVDGIKRDVLSVFDDQAPSARLLRTIEHGAELILRKKPDESVANLTAFGDTTRRSASMMFVPVRDEHKVIGMLSIQSYKQNAYTQANLDTLQSLADQCAGALSRIHSRERLRQTSDQMIEAQKIAHLGNFVWNARTDQLTGSNELYRIHGIEPGSAKLSMEFCLGIVHEADRPRVRAAFHAVMIHSTPLSEDYRVRYPDDSIHWLHARARTLFDKQGKITGMEGTCLDITELKRHERFTEEHRAVLEKIARGEPLKVTLTALALAIENHSSEMLCSLMLMSEDGKHLKSFVGPRLPAEYTAVADGVEIGPEVGSCGTAAFLKKTVIVTDIATDPLWKRFHHYATKHGLRACWSTPIMDSQGRVLATFAMYLRTCSAPTAEQEYTITIATQTAAIAIIRHREELTLKQSGERLHAIIENTPNVCIQWYDVDGRVLYWNPASEAVFGWKSSDAIGKTLDELTLDPEQTKQFHTLLQQINANGNHVGPMEFKFKRRDGSSGICLSTLFAIPSSNGNRQFVCMDVDITERVESEKTLRESQQQYSNLVNNIDGIVWEADVQTLVTTFVSVQAERILGYSVNEWLTDKNFWQEHIHPDDRKKAVDFCAAQTQLGLSQDSEYRMIAADGRIIWMRDLVAVTTKDGKPISMRGIMVDITERKKAEEALRESEERLQVSIEAANIGSWDWDLKTDRVNFSPQWKAHLGFKPDELEDTYNTWADRLHPDDKALTLATMNAYLRGITPTYEVEFRLRHKDDSYRWIYTKGRILIDGSNTPSRIVGCHVDITERKRFESEQARSFSLLQAAIESSNEGLLVVDLTGSVTLYNQQFVQFWNIPPEILATRDDATLLNHVLSSIKNPDLFIAGVKKLYGHPELESFDLIELKDGRYCERYSQPQRLGEDIVGRVWSFRDITARKTAADQIQRVNARLKKLSKRLIDIQEAERRHLARELHDELGQTLTATKILLQTATAKADMALEGMRINPSQSDHQKLVQEAITHTDHMLKTVRNLSLNLRPPMLDDFGLLSALRWLVDQHVRTTNRPVEFESELFEERFSPAIETACFRVAQEALTNVSRYSHATKVTVSLRRENDALLLLIRDNGIGFDVEAAIKRTKEGDTLGLSNLRERATLIGGNLEFISKPGKGTEVRATFPLEDIEPVATL